MHEPNSTREYKVVVNHEDQYALWPIDRENAPGWKDAGRRGTKEACLEYVKRVWTDMRPRSLRDKTLEPPRD
jgi:MbtH protein